MLADTHSHLYFEDFRSDLAEVLKRARDSGVTHVMVPGIDLATSSQAITLSETYPGVSAAVGVHPNEIGDRWDETTLHELKNLAQRPKVRAIGEIGLDYYRERTPHRLQEEALRAQLALAAEIGLPVILHNREALFDLWPLLSDWQQALANSGLPLARRPGVLHSYDGDLETALRAAQQHFLIGVSGPVTFKNAKERQRIMAALPLEAMVLETDAPFLTPHPFRGRRNEPARIAHIAQKLAELKGLPLEEVAGVTTQNAKRLFNWNEDQ